MKNAQWKSRAPVEITATSGAMPLVVAGQTFHEAREQGAVDRLLRTYARMRVGPCTAPAGCPRRPKP
ncbi:hypothetical protein AB0L88_00370 [Saccharopolyspora shandongensis]|uniref:hypothetical protein n=1 Tax=Saccharopolyspora shandongensis TaxID=418495 RepID=UPI0034256D7E